MPPTILHLIDTGGPGGAETVFLRLVRGAAERGCRSIACVPERDWLHRRLVEQGEEVRVVPSSGSFDLAYLARILGMARRHGVDLMHTHLLTSSVYGSVAARLLRIPVICTFHGQVDITSADPLLGLKFRILSRAADRVVFVSESLRRHYLEHTPIGREVSAVIHNGIDRDRYGDSSRREVRAELGVGEDEVLVGAVGNLRPAKGYEILIRAAARLHRQDRAYRFVVAGQGGGDLGRRLEGLRDRLLPGGAFRFLGFREDVPRLLAGFDVFVLSSTSEGFSLSTVEAMAAGLPVVATRSGGPEEIVEHGESGLLVESGSPAALARGIRRVVASRELRVRLVEGARRRVREAFGVESMVAAYSRLYASCLGRSTLGKQAEGRIRDSHRAVTDV